MSLRAPFPYFGGKARAATSIWRAFGDPGGYIEPFCGSAAVLLARPPFIGRRVETVNDADGWLVNAWRAIQLSPDAVAAAAYGPVAEIDYHARLAWLQERRTPELVAWLEGDPEAHDAKAAGWWLYVLACGIGDPFRPGPWRVVDGHLVKTDTSKGINRELPHLGYAGQGINRELPHLGNARDALTCYMRALSERLEGVRITCGDWRRVLSGAAIRSRSGGDGSIAVLLDPPYGIGFTPAYETADDTSTCVREWCAEADSDIRIVLCGYDDQHDELLALGWHKQSGRAGSGRGYSADPHNGRRERLWLSPACHTANQLFEVFT